jgi:hypothetical protein
MIGRGEKKGRIYLIDLGLVKKIFKPNGEMIPVCNFVFILNRFIYKSPVKV